MPTMRALYSLVCRLRTIHALTQGIVSLAREGWAAATPVQLLVLACGLAIALRVLVPSPSPEGGQTRVRMDRLLSMAAAAAIIGLSASEIAGSCLCLGSLVLRL